MNKEELKENWLKIVDLIANAKGIVDLVDAEQIFLKALAQQKEKIIKIGEKRKVSKREEKDGSDKSWNIMAFYHNQAIKDYQDKIDKL